MTQCEPAYEIRFFDRANRSFTSSVNLIDDLNWGRKLDDTSRCDFTFQITDDSCCEQLGMLEPFAHKIGVYEDNVMVWYGWILDVEYKRKTVSVDAFDIIGWLKRRKVHYDHTWTDEDLANIFLDIWNDANAPDPISGAEVIIVPTGVFETRSIQASENRTSWNAVREMLDTGLDITAFGQKLIAGIIHTTRPIELSLSDFDGDVSVKKAGADYANSITVDANSAAVAVYPPASAPSGNDIYPLVEEIIRDSQIQDEQSAFNAAKARYEYNRIVPRIITNTDSLVLQPNANVKINDLIPGIRILVDTFGLCYNTKQEFRLGSVDVSVASGKRKISISLQPVGPIDSLAQADDPIL